MTATICEGLNILELGSGSIAASLCGMILADNGARVIKIEPPDGDRLRRASPSGFLVWNRSKESLVLDLRTRAGQAEFKKLAEVADVVVEAFSPGVADDWGIGYGTLGETNRRLVYCSITGFGSLGDYAHLKGFEAVVAAKTGMFTPGAYMGRNAGPTPRFVSAPLASIGAGHLALSGIMAALTARLTSGQGQRVEATLLQGLHSLDFFGTMQWQYEVQHPDDDSTSTVTFSRPPSLLCSKDGRWICNSPSLVHQRRALIRALGIEWLWTDDRFKELPKFADQATAAAYRDVFFDTFRQRDLSEWLPILLADPDIPFEVLRTSEEGMDHPQAVHNGQVVEVKDPRMGVIHEVGPIASFAITPSVIARSAPVLDGHSSRPLQLMDVQPTNEGIWPRHPLSGITIVELGYFYALPFGMTMACSYGARVIKVEPLTGDPLRSLFGAPEVSAVKVMEGKESIAIDLQEPEGKKILHELLARADVFAFGLRPGVAQRLGLDYDSVRRINPRIVYLHATGYGTSGPYSHRPLFAPQATAPAGAYARQSAHWLDPKLTAGRSVDEIKAVAEWLHPPSDGDSNPALAVISALTLAMYHRKRTGQGQFVSTTMIGGNAYAYSDDYNRYKAKPQLRSLDPGQLGFGALYRIYPTKAGWLVVAAPSDAEWKELVTALDRPDLLDDERFLNGEERQRHDTELVALLSEIFATRSATQWEQLLAPRHIGAVEVFAGYMDDFTNCDSVLVDTGLVGYVDHPIFGPILRHGIPVKFSRTPGRLAPGCMLGQHTNSILAELGYDQDDISSLAAQGIVLKEPMIAEALHRQG